MNRMAGLEAIESCNIDDYRVWDMICEGSVKGCFQIESFLGKKWCKKIKPRSIAELSDVIALIRPGCLASSSGGKSMTDIYCDRKHKLEEVTSLHPLIDDVLAPTYGVIVYQEQAMKIAEKMANFTLEQADDLRKAIGKKKADLMKKVRTQFIDGCLANSITEDKAVEVFDIIEKSNRYSFNKSHSVCYAINSYRSAFTKFHRPRKFLTYWLQFAKEKVDPDFEVKENVMSAKQQDIQVLGPHYKFLSEDFFWDSKNKGVRFGVCNIKNVGSSHYEELKKYIDENNNPTWTQLLLECLFNVGKRAVEGMISVGVFSGLGKSRTEMLHEYSCIQDLTDKEVAILVSNYNKNNNILSILQEFVSKGTKKNGGFISTAARQGKIEAIIDRLLNPGRSLSDAPSVYSRLETSLLGCWVHHSELSGSADAAHADTKCIEVVNGKLSKSIIAGVIKKIKVHTTKKGEDMCFLSIEDDTSELENIVIFTELYGQNKDIIYQDAGVLISGEIKDAARKSFIVESIFLI
jgi:DNA polymerase-3 subunit alpha